MPAARLTHFRHEQASPAGRSILAQAVVAAARARSAQLRDVFDSASEPAHARAASTRLKKAVAEGRLKQLSTSDKLAGKLSLADKEASIFDSGSWCRGCAPTFPLANVVSSNAQRVASNNDNMMAMYRKTNKVGLVVSLTQCFTQVCRGEESPTCDDASK